MIPFLLAVLAVVQLLGAVGVIAGLFALVDCLTRPEGDQ